MITKIDYISIRPIDNPPGTQPSMVYPGDLVRKVYGICFKSFGVLLSTTGHTATVLWS